MAVDLEQYLYDRVKPIMEQWDEPGIYAISFFVYSNEAYVYHGVSNVSEFSIGYNTEEDCGSASAYSEERWNFAYWRQDMTHIIDPVDDDEGMKILFQWYKENGIEGVGREDWDTAYDETGAFIGKGPVGYYELLCAVSNVAKRLQTEGVAERTAGRRVPIIVHDLEYPWYVEEATEIANPYGEAAGFLKAVRDGYPAS